MRIRKNRLSYSKKLNHRYFSSISLHTYDIYYLFYHRMMICSKRVDRFQLLRLKVTSIRLISQKKRRFKRDNTLYVKSGRTTRTATHGLTHFFVQEVAKRNFVDGENDFGIGRQIMRVYITKWIQYCNARKWMVSLTL